MELIGCLVTTLCILARHEFSETLFEAQSAAFDYLIRGVSLLPSTTDQNALDIDEFVILVKALNVLSNGFWNHARTLYEGDKYSMAIRFLLQACEISSRLCTLGRDDILPPEFREVLRGLRDRLPRRWQALAESYLKIGDRRVCLICLHFDCNLTTV